ncbi:MAG: phenylacetate-CoA oxygenase subunit PaaC [Saprospiraceae bacterium]|nr:phenylacetate-CoA oxygenase subunit PaaC [Saprospiraceae bacterium]
MSLKNYTLFLADTSLILGQRLGEWCGHGPVLEQDIALTNIALDYVGRARLLYQYVSELDANGKSEDNYAMMREEREFKNLLLVEHPNIDFGFTVARQFLIDAFFVPYLEELSKSKNERLSHIADKALKESQYHLRWSSEWMIRLGDGTEESHKRIQSAVNSLWEFSGELFSPVPYEKEMLLEGIAPDVENILTRWNQSVNSVFSEATIIKPKDSWFQKGGKEGVHTEHLGYILSDMQYLQRTYPGQDW